MDTEQEKSERNRDKFCHNYGFLGQVEDSVDTEEELIKHDQERQKKKTKSRRLNVKRKGYHEVRLKEDDSTQGEDTPVHAPKCTEDTHVVLDSRSVKDNTENKNEEFMLQHIINPKMKIFARDLPPHLQFHVVFISHSNDLQWLSKVIQKAQSPPYCFRCACLHQDSFSKSSLLRSVHHSLKSASKTVLVLTRDFIRDVWLLSDMQLLSEMHVILTNPNLVLLHTESCDIPKALSELCTIDTYNNLNWWSELLTQLCAAADSPETEVMSMSSSFASSKPNIQSGQLLLSVRSTCGSCGKEFVDPSDVPEELASHGIHIPADEYHSAVSHLMSDQKFLCHVWCYNVPAAIVFFGLLLCLCLSVIPLLEIHLSEHPTETGLEFVHGGIVWLCGLTVYMFIIQISKKKMKLNTYKRLSVVNSKLMKYHILTGLENLGLADCNKYYLHFFYIETGPCIEYLEELLMSLSEHNEERKTADNVNYVIEIEDDEKVCKSLVSGVITNATRQNQVGQLLLQHSGEYISLMITKKLQTPAKMRHLENGPCLCQHLEHKLYHMLAE